MNYSRHGNPNNPPILFLHGAGVGGWMWDRQIAHFQHTHYCIVPTFQITKNSLLHDLAGTFLQDLQPYIQNEQRIILVGFSMGAQIAVEMCARRPEYFSHVMVNSGLIDPKPVIQKVIYPLLPLFNLLPRSRWFSLKQAKELYITEAYFERYFAGAKAVTTAELRTVMDENLTFDLPKGIKQYTGKLLITIGDQEKRLLTRSVEKLKVAVPNTKALMIKDMKHGYPIGRPESFNQLLEAWLSEDLLPEGEFI